MLQDQQNLHAVEVCEVRGDRKHKSHSIKHILPLQQLHDDIYVSFIRKNFIELD